MVSLIFLAPLPIWALSAHPGRWGRILGVVLVALVAVEVAVALHVIFQAARLTLLVCLPVATAVVVVAGLAVGDPGKGRRRHHVGIALSVVYSAVAVFGAFMVFLIVVDSYPSKPPPASEVEPLPSGLYIDQDTSWCGTGSGDFCDRNLVIASHAPASSAAVLAELRASLTTRGWGLAPDGRGGWMADTSVGVLLDVHHEDIDVSIVNGHVTVDLEEGAGDY